MKKLISYKAASIISVSLICLTIFFHISILIGILYFNLKPMGYLWGGRMETINELIKFEIISLVVLSICLFFILIKIDILKIKSHKKISHVFMWLLFFMFSLNTLGNLFAETNFERWFSLVTALLAISSLRLGLER